MHSARHTVGSLHLVAERVTATVELEVLARRVAVDADLLGNGISQVLVDLGEDGTLSSNDVLVSTKLHVGGNVLDESLLGALIKDLLPQLSRLVKVFLGDGSEEGDSFALEVAVDRAEIDRSLLELHGILRGPGDRSLVSKGYHFNQNTANSQVVGSSTLVVDRHLSVPLEVTKPHGADGSVDRKLLVVGPDSVSVGVGVRE